MAELLRFSEDFDTMTFPQCIAFIERSRRKIDRFEQIVPPGASFDRAELAAIRHGFDDLEKRIRSHPDCP